MKDTYPVTTYLSDLPMAVREEGHDDVELGALEGDAFIPNGEHTAKHDKQAGILTRWMPPRLQIFFENLSRIKVRSFLEGMISIEKQQLTGHVRQIMLLLLITFLALIIFIWWVGTLPQSVSRSISIPPKSLALSAQIAGILNGSAIPNYVLTYGTSTLVGLRGS